MDRAVGMEEPVIFPHGGGGSWRAAPRRYGIEECYRYVREIAPLCPRLEVVVPKADLRYAVREIETALAHLREQLDHDDVHRALPPSRERQLELKVRLLRAAWEREILKGDEEVGYVPELHPLDRLVQMEGWWKRARGRAEGKTYPWDDMAETVARISGASEVRDGAHRPTEADMRRAREFSGGTHVTSPMGFPVPRWTP